MPHQFNSLFDSLFIGIVVVSVKASLNEIRQTVYNAYEYEDFWVLVFYYLVYSRKETFWI